METLAAGYADPNWVPHKITCAAWSWIGEDRIHSVITGKDGFFDHGLRVKRLRPLLDAIAEADVLTGHNIIRYDLPVLNAEIMRSAGKPLDPIMAEDTIRLPKTKGLKKGLDNLSHILGVPASKLPLNWAEWDEAYEEKGWPEVIRRCESDVVLHKQERQAAIDAGWSKPARRWTP